MFLMIALIVWKKKKEKKGESFNRIWPINFFDFID